MLAPGSLATRRCGRSKLQGGRAFVACHLLLACKEKYIGLMAWGQASLACVIRGLVQLNDMIQAPTFGRSTAKDDARVLALLLHT
jgi:hypothetical protein